jgi:nucleoside-diphosphate-sugar epimerase
MTTFITGGTTPLGRVVVKELVRQGEALRILVRPNSERAGLELPGVAFVRGDIADPVAVRKGLTGCDRICHIAAVTGLRHADAEVWRVNCDGTQNLLQATRDMHVSSVVQVSSLTVFGPTTGERPADESKPIDPAAMSTVFQRSRLAADDIALEFADKGVNIKLVYPGFGYGYASTYGHPGFAGETLLRMAAGKSVAIVGNGYNRICLTYYKDTAQGIELAHEQGQPGESYILAGECRALPEIWEIVAEVLSKNPPTRRVPLWLARISGWFGGKASHSSEYLNIVRQNWHYSSQKARRELGWQPLSLREAMAETWAEYQAAGAAADRKRAEYAARRA